MEKVVAKPELLLSTAHSLCPGCGEPLVLRVLLELVAELGLRERTVCVCGIGCYTAFPAIMDVDVVQALHGRAPSVATGAKRVLPDRFVFTLQGDGDMVSEGLQEIIHCAARGEKLTAVLLNNGVFGETGGHMTATSVVGQRTKTTMATGRVPAQHGWPIKIADLLAQLDGTVYVARGAVHTPAAIRFTKDCLRAAFETQLGGRGFSFVEVLTMCPTDWYVDAAETPDWVEKNFAPTYPVRVLKSV
jgi:2-oxoglutarate/2-oxoacid ferredoxin oxidoreductase subunit beta